MAGGILSRIEGWRVWPEEGPVQWFLRPYAALLPAHAHTLTVLLQTHTPAPNQSAFRLQIL
eukprot:3608425-Pleurochrysis_carterae.AAC.2